MFQSTLPHGERLSHQYHLTFLLSVSIHAPGGATHVKITKSLQTRFQIHAPARGATHAYRHRHQGKYLFSIHAPARERLYASVSPHVLLKCFNPRSRTGATHVKMHKIAPSRFQSTLPHGSDLCLQAPASRVRLFQSTLPHGERLSLGVFLPAKF